jgi:type III secretion protein R
MNPTNFDPLSLALVLAALSLLPMLLVCTTCFLKVSMVLIIVKNAIGVQQVPPNIAIYSIALAVTAFVMAPVFNEVADALPRQVKGAPVPDKQVGIPELVTALEPMRRFMLANTLPEKRDHFLALATRQWRPSMGAAPTPSDYLVLIPTFVVSELELALQAGFVLYIPFVVIDLLISNLLLALGMQMVSPMVVSLPLKMLLFVMLDGWTKLIDGLVLSYL